MSEYKIDFPDASYKENEKYKGHLQEQEEDTEEDDTNKRIEDIIKILRDEDFTNLKKRLKFASLIMELIISSNDSKVRGIIKKLSDVLTDVGNEFLGESTLTGKSVFNFSGKDEIGYFWVVLKSSGVSELEDICFEANIFDMVAQMKGGLKGDEIIGIYKTEKEAKRIATKELSNQRG